MYITVSSYKGTLPGNKKEQIMNAHNLDDSPRNYAESKKAAPMKGDGDPHVSSLQPTNANENEG